ncbi:VPLPA-CTERM sorting domain-containing protein [Paracoccus sediminis]|uniref:VPLPA-CTERM protein sorting domain-containing protein n=2 Tax=Paracoccus sediminis TaxID=1214787 RepID=A0A238W344_9RHOB|nr:VPLPA-CTERM sorting domain-containing protein [Paracoccus sediminis]SNR40972.1 VPLPA-CTERM protein sorting domain-containing protein [Paracoccus sediminis]
MMMSKLRLVALSLAGAAFVGSAASAAVVRVDQANFKPSAGLITFSEFALGAVNPTYNPADYGGGAGAPTVTFDGWFLGQSLSLDPAADCPGGVPSACVVGTPNAGLSLDPNAPDTFITSDSAAPNSPVLSGSPLFNGTVAVLFDTDQFGVGFDAGFFDNFGSLGLTAFNRNGDLLGTVSNVGLGIEFLGLVSDAADIAGVLFSLTGVEGAGFAIDSLRFGERGDIIVDPSPVPLPAAGWLLVASMGGMAALRRRRNP